MTRSLTDISMKFMILLFVQRYFHFMLTAIMLLSNVSVYLLTITLCVESIYDIESRQYFWTDKCFLRYLQDIAKCVWKLVGVLFENIIWKWKQDFSQNIYEYSCHLCRNRIPKIFEWKTLRQKGIEWLCGNYSTYTLYKCIHIVRRSLRRKLDRVRHSMNVLNIHNVFIHSMLMFLQMFSQAYLSHTVMTFASHLPCMIAQNSNFLV